MTDLLDRLNAAIGTRYRIESELGAGGMGTVYKVYDRERQASIALKTLHRAEASAIYRFKKEFRALAGVAHGNLIHLYELVAHDDIWFFTMELIEGDDFLQYVRPGAGNGGLSDDVTQVDPVIAVPVVSREHEVVPVATTGTLDEPRLRLALSQLSWGVAALHEAGKIHRDIKPSNVLVTEDGRLVILDFGIAAEISTSASLKTVADGISGTVAYMSPEQCVGKECGPASDWYSVGVLLYEALTGDVPFSGSLLQVLVQKAATDPPRPDELVTGLPGDLVELCMSLLARDPEDRPTDTELLARLQLSQPGVVIDQPARLAEGVPLVGRDRHLAVLDDAFDTAARRRTVSVCVHGPSGIGKTSLVRYFTARLVQDERAVVLAGRCYVRESVPYKALDGIVDMLSRLLRSLPADVVERRLPQDTAALARVFPVLKRVEAVERRAAVALDIADQRELRRRAFTAFRDILGTISQQLPVVVHIDDLQWADRDSADVLDELLLSAERRRLLFILSFRSEDVAGVPFLKQLLAGAGTKVRRSLEVGPLTSADAADFAQQRLGVERPDAEAYAQTLARESDGNPFLLDQMVRVALEAGGNGDDGALGLDEMLNARVRQMPPGARQLMDVLAVAGQPIDAEVAYSAAELTGDERSLVTSLQLAHFVRVSARTERIDLYHDRIRETYLCELEAAKVRDIHRRLAEALEAKGIDDPESLYEHYRGVGDNRRAAAFAARTAVEAQEALAFERAALFYQRALDLCADPGAETASWYVGLGDARASAGRGGEAARAYLEAINMVDDRTALELERRAGQQLMISGRIEEGLEVIAKVLRKADLPQLAPSPKRALLSLVLRRLRVTLRGLRYKECNADQVPAGDLTRIDTCWTVAEGMALVDNIQGAAFQTLHLLLALGAGEPNRIARALAMEAGFAASSGASIKSARLLAEAERLANRLGSRTTVGLCRMIGAVAALHDGEWRKAESLAREAQEILTGQHSLAEWPLNTARVYHISALIDQGKVAELSRVSRRFLDDALDRGSLFVATMFRTGWSTLMWLSADDVAGARDALTRALSQCPDGVFYVTHYNCLVARGLTDLYVGEGEAAFQCISDVWPLVERSQILRIRSVRVRCLRMHAACALAAAATARDPKPLLAVVDRDARRMERERYCSVISNRAKARLLRAGLEATRGNCSAALQHLTSAIEGLEESGCALFLAVARRRKGELLGGDEGRALVAGADRWMAGEGIVNPRCMTKAFVPGFPDVDQA